MLTRKTQYAWMTMGGLICLFGLVLACKLRDGNKAVAQADPLPAAPPLVKEDKDLSLPPPAASLENKPAASVSGLMPFTPETVPPPKAEKSESNDKSKPKSEPKAVLGDPSPMAPPPPPGKPMSGPPPLETARPQLPTATGLVLPASFAPNTPTPNEAKKDEKPKATSPSVADAPPPMTSDKAIKTPTPEPSGSISLPNKAPEARSVPFSPLTVAKDLPSHGAPDANFAPARYAPTTAAPPSGLQGAGQEVKVQPGEPPLAPAPGPVQIYHVHGSETLQDIARRTLGSSERWTDLHKLNPTLKPDTPLSAGTTVRLPGDACVQNDEAEPVKPLPALRPKPTPPKAKVLPLTGTYQCSLDEKNQLTLPRAIRDQLAGSDTVMISPGPDKCLWLTNQSHLERLGERLEQSQANETDVRVFKRLYFAQTEKLPVNGDGRVALPDRLALFAGLHQELVLVGIDDHFEVWDAARWRQYTQQKSATVTHSTSMSESE